MPRKTNGNEIQDTVMDTPERSEVIDLTAAEGRSVLAAWQGMVHLFGATVESWNVTSDGVEAHGFSVSGEYDPRTIVRDISSRERRLDLLTTFPTLKGEEPPQFTDAADITAFTVQFYKGAVEEGSARSPSYVKTAVAAYKAANALAKKRGPKPKIIRLNNLDNLDEEALQNIDASELAKLQAAVERVMAQKQAASDQAAAISAA